jgi:AraC-like DNA-binding protein
VLTLRLSLHTEDFNYLRSVFSRIYPHHPLLHGIVKGYQILHTQLPDNIPLPVLPFPPHAVQALVFYGRDATASFNYRTGEHNVQPCGIIVGPQVSRVDVTVGRDMLMIAAFFEPGGLHRLLGIPMYKLFDESLDASLLWNKEIRNLEERFRNTNVYDDMHEMIENFLIAQIRKRKIENHPIDKALTQLENIDQSASLDYLADQACLSPRQFERKCQERLGLGPKIFMRIARFSKAYRLKERRPDLAWMDVALSCGYYDLQHLRRDFREFASATPTILLMEESRSNLRGYSSHDF